MTDKLDDTWSTRDFPVLVAAARLLEEGRPPFQTHEVAEAAGLPAADVVRAFRGLHPTYVSGEMLSSLGGSDDAIFRSLTERGRRAVGLWPSGESVDALVDALRQAEDAEQDPEEKSNIRRAAGAVLGVSRDVMVDVVAAVVARQSGLG